MPAAQAHGVEEALAPALILVEDAGEVRRLHDRLGLVDGAQRHALVGGADHHGDAERGETLLDGLADLRRERLLHLQPAGEDVDHAREFRQTDNPLVRQIGDVRDAGERRDMVLAMAFEAHVAQQDHVVIAGHILEGAGELGGRIRAIAAEALLEGLDHALGGIGQPGARWVVTRPGEQRAHRLLSLFAGGQGRRRGLQLDARNILHGAILRVTALGVKRLRVVVRDVRGARLPYIIGTGGSKGKTGGFTSSGDTWPI